jgi:hypothetical protein
LQAGRPAFGALLQRGHIIRREIKPHHAVQKLGSLGERKA